MTGKRQSNDNVRHARHSKPDLGQKEAKLEKASEEELRHMDGETAKSQQRAGDPDLGQKEAAQEKASEKELRHMEGGTAAESARTAKSSSR
jgi:hypothetical protein